jgi:hypothetical protein
MDKARDSAAGHLYVEQAQYHVVHGVDTRRHSGNARTFLFQNGVYTSVGTLVTTPVWPSARKLAVRVSAHTGNRVRPNAGIKQQAPGEHSQPK